MVGEAGKGVVRLGLAGKDRLGGVWMGPAGKRLGWDGTGKA